MKHFYRVILLISVFLSAIICNPSLLAENYNSSSPEFSISSSLASAAYQINPVSPLNKTIFSSGTNIVDVQWQWVVGEPSVSYSFEVEFYIFYINSSIYICELLDSNVNSYSITSLLPATKVQWRVCSIDEFGERIYSGWSTFFIKRVGPLFVKPDGSGSGSSWGNSCNLQTALSQAIYGDELWLASGVYKPTGGASRDVSFEIQDGITVFGGFNGNETLSSQRNWSVNKTVLSGDIGIADNESDNSYNVVKMTGVASDPITDKTVLDGIIIQNGMADNLSQGWDRGAGLQLSHASPLIVNTWFINNKALNFGGGVFGNSFSQPQFYNSVFSNNVSQKYGGGVFANSEMHFINCLFWGNHAVDRAGAINGPELPNSLYLYNSILWNNTAGSNNQVYNTFVYYSIVEGGIPGVWILVENPQFLNPSDNDFRINSKSPAIDTGNDSFIPGFLTKDYNGNARKEGVRVDIGIYESATHAPFPLLPSNNQLFSAFTSTVDISWQWDVATPSNIVSYSIEYVKNSQNVIRFDGIYEFSSIIPGLKPTDRVSWRVAGVTNTGDYLWSQWSAFSIRRKGPIFVKPDATGSGTSWEDATNFQDALSSAVWGDELWLLAGVYKPTESGDRNISFVLKDGLKIYGGFLDTNSSIEQRQLSVNQTILSGDIGVEANFADNSFHVVKSIGTVSKPITNATVLDGLVIEHGNAELYAGNNANGGGLYLIISSPILKNVWFRNNISKDTGAAVYGDNQSNPIFANTIFSNNSAEWNGGALASNASMIFYNCLWYNNYSSYWSGSADATTNNTTLVYNSISWANRAQHGFNDFRNIRIRTSLVEDGTGIGSLTANPMFKDPNNNDFSLLNASPAINSGNSTTVPVWLTTDYNGGARIIGSTVDMGPFESDVNSSLDLIYNDNRFTITPNPVKAGTEISLYINRERNANCKIRLIDLTGKVISIDSVNDGTFHINRNTASGVYILEVELFNGQITRKKILVME